MTNYYLDSCIWRDHYENRSGPKGRPLGAYATKLVMKILKNKDVIIFSDLTVNELMTEYDQKEINDMLRMLSLLGLLVYVKPKDSDFFEARTLAKTRDVPFPDVLHAIIARNNSAVLISQDKHFQELTDVVHVKKPEEII